MGLSVQFMDRPKDLQRVSKLLLKGILLSPGSLKKDHVLPKRYRQKFLSFRTVFFFTPNRYNKKKQLRNNIVTISEKKNISSQNIKSTFVIH